MPGLGDFLGSLISEMARARLQADAETVRIADLYANHDQLKHFPVPRFRLPDVRIEVPVVLEADEGSKKPELDEGLIFDSFFELVDAFEFPRISLRGAHLKRLSTDLRARIRRIADRSPPPASHQIADYLLDSFVDSLPDDEETRLDIERLRSAIRRRLIEQINAAKAGSKPIRVLPSTASVKEVRDSEHLMRLSLSLTEEAMEWTLTDTDGVEESRLVQE